MSKAYHGVPEGPDYQHSGAVRIFVDGVDTGALNPRLDLRRHSPSGFAWNYYGSGPAQLALAILADVSGDDAIAGRLYQDFKAQVVAKLEAGPWELAAADVEAWIAKARKEREL